MLAEWVGPRFAGYVIEVLASPHGNRGEELLELDRRSSRRGCRIGCVESFLQLPGIDAQVFISAQMKYTSALLQEPGRVALGSMRFE